MPKNPLAFPNEKRRVSPKANRTVAIREASDAVWGMLRTVSTAYDLTPVESHKVLCFVAQNFICEIVKNEDKEDFARCINSVFDYMQRNGM